MHHCSYTEISAAIGVYYLYTLIYLDFGYLVFF